MNLHLIPKTAGLPASPAHSRPALTRAKRIAIELLAPPVFGFAMLVLPFALPNVVGSIVFLTFDLRTGAGFIVAGLFYAYLLAGIPSVVFTAVMEWRFACGLDPASWRAVWLAAVLGGVAGIAMGTFPRGLDFTWDGLLPALALSAVGALVGGLVGGLIRWRSLAR